MILSVSRRGGLFVSLQSEAIGGWVGIRIEESQVVEPK